ncbi:relaxase/mobilization nuclease domain-containing protein (plasmid) [Clostridium perfringens]
MAYVREKPIKVTVYKAINYIVNEKKTEQGSLVYGVNCSINPKIATKQMKTERENFKKDSGILAHHFYQSFKPGEIKDFNTAFEIGIKFAEQLTKEGKFKAVVVTHTDKKHIHNHIIMNSVNSEGKKYLSNKKSYEELKKISNDLTKEYGLSVIEPKGKGISYKEWQENKKGNSWKAKIRNDIDKYIEEVKNFDELLNTLREKGYEIKHGENVKHMAFKYPGQQRFTRGKTIGEDYTEEKIKERIKESLEKNSFRFNTFKEENKKYIRINRENKYRYKKANLANNIILTMMLVKELLNKNEVKSNPKKIIYAEKSVKNLEKTLQFINDKKITSLDEVKNEINKVNEKINKVEELIKELNNMNDKLNTIKIHIEKYKKNKEIYNEYNKKNILTKKIFFKNNINEINEFENSKAILDKLNIKEENFEKIYNDLKDIEGNIKKYEGKKEYLKNSKREIEDVVKSINDIKSREIINTLEKYNEKSKKYTIEK